VITLRHTILPGLLLAVGNFAPVRAQQPMISATYEELRGSNVTVTPVFGLAGNAGSLAIKVEIRNLTTSERTWTLSLAEGYPSRTLSTKAVFSFQVPAGQVSSHDVLLPLSPNFISSNYRNFLTELSTAGQKLEQRNDSFDNNEALGILALSEQLATRSLAALDQAWVRGSSDKRFGLSYDPKNLPRDWRGYSALDALLIDLPAWKALPRETVRAILTWVRLGGVLDIYTENTSPTLAEIGLKIPDPYDDKKTQLDLSLGTIRVFPWNGTELSNKITSHYNQIPSRDDALTQGSGLEKQIGSPEVQGGLAFAILFVFAIIVGPFNLFFLAKKGRRHRLFVTTPIISFVACVLVVLLIIFREGIGGSGYRVAFAELTHDPDGSRLLLTQSQVSRTGVMFGSGFETDDPLQMDPAQMADSLYNPLSNVTGLTTTYLFREHRHDGGFFRSRSEQGFLVRAALPTRSRIEQNSVVETNDDVFSTPAPPILVSSLGVTITELFFRDEGGAVWHCTTPTPPGGTFKLTPSTTKNLQTWLTAQGTSLPEKIRDETRRIGEQNGRYVALAPDAPELSLATHPEIRWQTTPTLLTGLPVPRSSSPVAPAAPAP
jgi:hypothetical protein